MDLFPKKLVNNCFEMTIRMSYMTYMVRVMPHKYEQWHVRVDKYTILQCVYYL